MADQKLTALTADGTPVGADLMYIVDDVAGTPTSKKITLTNLATGLAALSGLTAVFVSKSAYDANTILYATTDDTPVALTVAASRVVGRKASGDITAMTGAETFALLQITSASVTLTDTTPNSLTFVQWGTEEATIAQASCPTNAVVLAWLTGSMRAGPGTISANDRGDCELQISFDGGGSFTSVGTAQQANLPTTQLLRRYTVSRAVRATGTVTGDIQVRARCEDITAANDTTWDTGIITIMVFPQ